MSDVPTASTSRASTSSASTSQPSPYTFRLGNRDLTIDIECSTTDESDISSDDETDSIYEESDNSNEVDCVCEESDDNMDDSSWSSSASTVSVENKSSSGSEKSIKESNRESGSENITTDELLFPDGPPPVIPILILVQVYYITSLFYDLEKCYLVILSQEKIEITSFFKTAMKSLSLVIHS